MNGLGVLGHSLVANPIKPRGGLRRVQLDQIMRELALGRAARDRMMPYWCEAYSYALPSRELFLRKTENTNTDQPYENYDSTAMDALPRGVGFVEQTIMPPETEWVKLEAGARVPREQIDSVNAQLEPITARMFDFIQSSNDADQTREAGYDLFAGMGPMTIEKGDVANPIVVTAIPLPQVIPFRGPNGEIWRVYRDYRLPVELVREKYPEIETLPADWARLRGDERVPVVEASIYQPRTDDYVWLVVDPERKRPLMDPVVERTTKWVIPEWRRTTGDLYATGPLFDALPYMRSLDDNAREYDIALRLRNRPPLWADPQAAAANPFGINISPAAISYMGKDTLGPIALGADPQFGQMSIEDKRKAVRRILLDIDVLPPPEVAGEMTKAEVIIRKQEALEDAGANYGRLQSSWVAAKIRRVADVLQDFGEFPPVRVDGKEVRVRYVGPLAQAQDAAEAERTFEWATRARAAFGDEAFALGAIAEEAVRVTGKQMRVNSQAIRSPEEAQVLKQQMAQAAQAMQAAQGQQGAPGQAA